MNLNAPGTGWEKEGELATPIGFQDLPVDHENKPSRSKMVFLHLPSEGVSSGVVLGQTPSQEDPIYFLVRQSPEKQKNKQTVFVGLPGYLSKQPAVSGENLMNAQVFGIFSSSTPWALEAYDVA